MNDKVVLNLEGGKISRDSLHELIDQWVDINQDDEGYVWLYSTDDVGIILPFTNVVHGKGIMKTGSLYVMYEMIQYFTVENAKMDTMKFFTEDKLAKCKQCNSPCEMYTAYQFPDEVSNDDWLRFAQQRAKKQLLIDGIGRVIEAMTGEDPIGLNDLL